MRMESLHVNVSKCLHALCKINRTCCSECQNLLAKQIWNAEDRQRLLRCLAKLFLHRSCVVDICHCFAVIVRNIVEQVKQEINVLPTEEKFTVHQNFCIALSVAVGICDELVSFTVNYLKESAPIYFVTDASTSSEPETKKARKCHDPASPTPRELVHAVYRLSSHMTSELREMWDWSRFVEYILDQDPDTRWLALLSISRLFGFSPYQTEHLKDKLFTQDDRRELTLRYTGLTDRTARHVELLAKPDQPLEKDITGLTHTMKGILETDLNSAVVSVCGVLLPKLLVPPGGDFTHQELSEGNTGPQSFQSVEPLVPVSSTQANLRNLALAVASGEAVMLEGPVGSGKTALVERLAWLTGRDRVPLLMKIQLGDQTDSKTLLGTYRCSDVPGEFVWQPGSLTLAVTHGYWILLEDLDYAPMDVISILAPLLESRVLSLPGHGDELRAHPDFRIFATQRLLSSGSGLYKQHSTGCQILDKMWTKVLVQPLTKEELKQVIVQKYPKLNTVVDRLVGIYFLLASCHHESDSAEGVVTRSDEADDVGKYLSRDGRLICTRDLIKWVSRIAADFDVTRSTTASQVFQEAIDCFCACLSKPEKRLPLAEAIAARLNMTKVKAEFYMCKYKPSVEVSPSQLCVGRVTLPRQQRDMVALGRPVSRFAFTRQSVSLLERVAVCVSKCEPILLVGETGVGKTSSVQYLAEQLGHRLRVVNMNQQSDSVDLLGGFKPVDLRIIVSPFREEFELLFTSTFSRKQNARFLGHVQECYSKRRWPDMFKLMDHTHKAALVKFTQGSENHQKWQAVGNRLHQLKSQVKQTESALAFTFIEGSLVKAMRSGDWVLLDEINLASTETLECLSGLLESRDGSVVLMERGDTRPVYRHPDFRLFACMNPATDVGKKDLPPGLRNRFTELFVDELEESQELKILVAEYLKGLSLTGAQIDGIVKFYQVVRTEAIHKLTDGTGRKPHFSLRTLCRSLQQAAPNKYSNVLRSLYEAFCLGFLTQLDRSSHPVVEGLICRHVIGKTSVKGLLKQGLARPGGAEGSYRQFEGYWIAEGTTESKVPEGYVLTPSVRANLKDLARVVSAGRFPVLLQGETSVGKTSLITWLARSSGNVCTRINNHEHTDLQEYIGCYVADTTGKLVFQEGVLVEAMRKGHWIILDELNLAPTDVLEALNRLLDDNRELFISETQETVQAHPHFMLFATQNPPGQYGGRKVLSRAFRNRFIELHFDEIPPTELETILHERCAIPQSYCKKLVAVLLALQTRRRGSGVFAGKQGFITLRDLFRWAERYRLAAVEVKAKYFDWEQLLADNGYMLLAGRVRKQEETLVIQEVLEKHLKRKVVPSRLFTLNSDTSKTTEAILKKLVTDPPKGFEHVVWTYDMRRMAVLVAQSLWFGEPVLLVGETGCGKTTICQLYTSLQGQQLYSVNCHLHTESADFLGGLRPVRHRAEEEDSDQLRLFEWCDGPLVSAMKQGGVFLIDEISLADDSVLERLNSVLEPERTLLLVEKGSDGSHGNSGGNQVEQIVATSEFRVVATMNPGGDYGKKELSPALRNRFTEIWCPLNQDREDLIQIIEHNLESGILLSNQEDGSSGVGRSMMDFVDWFSNNDIGKRVTISIRDLLSWTRFINTTSITVQEEDRLPPDQTRSNWLEPAVAYIHGACLVFLDALGSGSVGSYDDGSTKRSRTRCLEFLYQQMVSMTGQEVSLSDLDLEQKKDDGDCSGHQGYIKNTENDFCIRPFCISRGPCIDSSLTHYALHAPTTCLNAQRLLRALQLPKPILLEGSPGVGKTSLVGAVAKAAGHQLVRINLSDQTDVSDLFGADLPVEGGEGGQFAWRDGPLLQALKAGHWIVLDELNLASQSVLEGLNACLDHRSEIYVPELSMSFQIQHEKTRIFACQNPLNQGGGRKGLPKSFLNRFTQVYIEPLCDEDLLFITTTMYPHIPTDILSKMIDFNNKVYQETMVTRQWGQRGSPWEFNLRDVFRWAELLVHNQNPEQFDPREYVGLIYTDRMRTEVDKTAVSSAYSGIFGEDGKPTTFSGEFKLSQSLLQVGHSFLERREGASFNSTLKRDQGLRVIHHTQPYLESLMKCIEMNWMAILVGPSGCGKTSLVHLLSELTGHTLRVLPMNSAMDTTELLGGFEQADVKRHLEDVVRQTREVVDGLVGSVMIKGVPEGVQVVTRVLEHWDRFNSTGHSGVPASHREEHSSLIRRSDSLTDLLRELLKVANTHSLPEQAHITQCLSTAQTLRTQLQTSGSTNHGGKFEWVDSVLVKALKEGHWLLVENVNFCSPSVLDRLNGLLEPDGVLSINERGVVGEGIPTVKPHTNFRLILSMDPKYGEISRAMRNRGVEIYLLGESDGVTYSDQDVKQMLMSSGLVGKVPCETLMDLQATVNNTGLGSRFSVIDLLSVARLTNQQLQRGVSVGSALVHSCEEVYVSPQIDPQVKKTMKEMVGSKLLDFDLRAWELAHQTSSLVDMETFPQATPAVSDWTDCITMATVTQTTAVFNHVIDQLSLTIGQNRQMSLTFTEFEDKMLGVSPQPRPFLSPPSNNLIQTLEALPHTLQLLVESSTKDSWQTLNQWLQNNINRKLSSEDLVTLTSDMLATGGGGAYEGGGATEGGLGTDCSKRLIWFARNVSTLLKESLETIHEHPLVEEVYKRWADVLGRSQDLAFVLKHPFDLRWSPQLLKYVRFKLTKSLTGPHMDSEFWTFLFSVSNQLMLSVWLRQSQLSHSTGLGESFSVKRYKKGELTALQVSQLVSTGGPVNTEHLGSDCFLHLSRFVQQMDDFLKTVFGTFRNLTDDTYRQTMESLAWYERFVSLCQRPLGPRGVGTFVPTLCLHWNWLYHKTLLHLEQAYSFPPDLTSTLSSLHRTLGRDHVTAHLQQALRSHCGHPAPYPSSSIADSVTTLLGLHRELDIMGKHAHRQTEFTRKVALWADRGSEVRSVLMAAWGSTLLEGEEAEVGDGGRIVETKRQETGSEVECVEKRGEDMDVDRSCDQQGDHLADTITAVESLLKQYKIQTKTASVPAVTSSAVQEVTETLDLNAKALALWPLVECVQILSQLDVLSRVLSGRQGDQISNSHHGNQNGLECWWEFQMQSGFVSPGLLLPWKLVSEDVKHVPSQHTHLVLTTLQRLTSTSVLRSPRLWLEWPPESLDESDWMAEKGSVTHTMCSAVLSSTVFSLCIGGDVSHSDRKRQSNTDGNIWLPGNITLGDMDLKLAQLRSLKKTLLQNLGAVSSKQWNFRHNLLNITTYQLQQLLKSVAMVTLPENNRTSAKEVICQMSSATDVQEVDRILHILSEVFNTDGLKPLLPEFYELVASCLEAYRECFTEYKQKRENIDPFSEMISLGRFVTLAGLLQAFLLAPQGPVDPAEKVAVKLEYTRQELKSVENEMFVRNWNHRVQTGLELDFSGSDSHPLLHYLVDRKQELCDNVKTYHQQRAHRPSPQQFDGLLRDSRQFLSTAASVVRVTGMLRKLQDEYKRLVKGRKGHTHVLSEVQVWGESAEEFVRRFQNNYPLYQDLYTPLLCGISQIHTGLELVACAVRMLHHRSELLLHKHNGSKLLLQTLTPHSPWLETSLENLCRFPFTRAGLGSSVEWVERLLSEECLGVVRVGLEGGYRLGGGDMSDADWREEKKDLSTVKQMTARVLKASLHLLKNSILLSQTLDEASLRTLATVFTRYLSSWQQQEAERLRKEEEEASLYKYKEQSHGKELKEDEQEEKERKRRFPSYEEDFQDIKVGFTLDDTTPVPDNGLIDGDDPSDLELEVTIGEEDMFDICQVHSQLFSSLTRTAWYKGQRSGVTIPTEVDYVEPALLCYQVAAKLGHKQAKNMVQDVDWHVLGGHLLTCSVLQNCGILDSTSVFKKTADGRPYDIYYHPNVPEVLQCRPLLDTFRTRVSELLKEWAEHPTLKELIIVIDRLKSFPVASPLMKFVTGLEVLVHKAAEWESNAARHVSLKDHIEAVTHRVIQWRKLELQGWKTCLDSELSRVKQRASKWWFYLYELVMEFVKEETEADPPSEGEGHSSEGQDHSEILKSLQTFMEKSTLGEFKVRLDLLYAFLGHLINMETSPKQEVLLKVLWNVHGYYSQFVTNVQQRVTHLRNPIEKELKNFVKIAQWNDRNFYSLRQAVQKTHKTLHKHIKQFQTVLGQPVQQVLTDTQPDWLSQSEAQKLGQGHSVQYEAFVLTPQYQPMPSHLPVAEESLLNSLTGLGSKCSKHITGVLTTSRLGERYTALEEFTGELIEAVHDIQNLNVDATATKEKQKSEAKHIHQRKRKALADLFKYLQTLGLSYRKGLVGYQDCQSHHKLLPPLDIGASLELSHGSGQTSTAADKVTMVTWDGCQKYQTRCVARNALLTASLASPSKELGPANIDRCKGFSAHLAACVTQQWEDLARDWQTLTQVKERLETLSAIARSSGYCVNQKEASKHVQHLGGAINEAFELIAQLKLVFHCFPESQSELNSVTSPLSQWQVAKLLVSCQGDEIWQTTFDKVKELEVMLLDVRGKVSKISKKKSMWISKEEVDSLKCNCEKLQGVIEILNDLEGSLLKPDSGEHNCISESLKFMGTKLQEVVCDFYSWESEERTKTSETEADSLVKKTCGQSEKVVKQVLLAVQGLVKVKETQGQGQTDEEETGSDLQESHLTEHLLQRVGEKIGKLRLKEVSGALNDLLTTLTGGELSSTDLVPQVLSGVLPLVHQYSLLTQYFLTHQIATLRGAAKLLSVLLAIFAELAQKGFCLPAEYSDEVEGEGATEFKDIEGGGLGQGEGVKDVSDQIESEDQLDEAQKPGDKKEEDTEEPDVKAEENAIEMSDDFEGKTQDMEPNKGEEEDEEEEESEQEVDKQMGDLDGEGETEKLDQQMWGSDGEDEEDDKETKDEFGAGAGDESQTELVAKEDNQQVKDEKKEEKRETKEEKGEDLEEGEVNEQQDVDQSEYREDDPHQTQDPEEQNPPPTMELPDNLDLDGKGQEDSDDEGEENTEGENPYDIDNMTKETKDEDLEEKAEPEDEEGHDKEENREEVEEGHDGKDAEEGHDGKEEERQEENMEVEEEGDIPNMDKGVEPQEDQDVDLSENKDEGEETSQETDNVPQAAEHAGKTSHDTQEVQQVQEARDSAGKSENEQQEKQGVGMSESLTQEGHLGEEKSSVTSGNSTDMAQRTSTKPGQSKDDRSLGSKEEKVQKRLKTVDTGMEQNEQKNDPDQKPTESSDLYEHIKDSSARYDTQTMDVATSEQQELQQPAEDGVIDGEDNEEEGDMEDVVPMEEEEMTSQEVDKLTALKTTDNRPEAVKPAGGDGMDTEETEQEKSVDGEKVLRLGVSRGQEGSVYTVIENLEYTPGELDIERLRQELEEDLHTWSQADNGNVVGMSDVAAGEAWHKYETVTAGLSQELCEQLRLVLEPTQASKLRGDYRTGKRLNMRKVIPYIASQFRKDKIWLRRTKPSKRNYQVVLAVDDSSSMADNHSKQLAFESLATIANALTLLEVGQLSVCSFGESVQELHPFHEQFGNQSGARLLQRFTFEQKKTKIAQLLQHMTAMLVKARSQQTGTVTNTETSQLLLIVSDGRGLFLEGVEVVKRAVRLAREASVFTVFVILDNPQNKDSILDIRVPVFRGPGQLPEIRSYMDHFPFPFYIILRDVNALPQVLSDALRQWFELVTVGDRI